MSENLKEELKTKALEWGADLCGIADLTTCGDEIAQVYGEEFTKYPTAVSFGVFLPNPVVDEVLEHPSHTYLAYYDIANALINQIALRLNNYLLKAGYDAYPIPASQRSGEAKEGSIFSHRQAAEMAGLGWIGKSCSLINEKVGPRLRLGTVLITPALEGDTPVENRCGECTKCQDICPSNAILGKAFSPKDDISERFDFHKCDDYLSEVRQTFGKRICGRCVAVCPYGRKNN
ncbi:MAG: 4Fe-4S double cluster binding domain-containing protein [Clostridiales bacterium]